MFLRSAANNIKPFSEIITSRTQKLLDDTAPAVNEMQAEMGKLTE